MSEKDHLLDLLIHDLTAPVSIVATSTSSLLEKEDRYGPLTSRQRQTLERILRNSTKAQALLMELVETYRSQEGVFHCRNFKIIDALKESLMDALEIADHATAAKLVFVKRDDAFFRILEEHGIIVELTGRYCLSPFFHDQKKVQQVLRNLISNALKYRRQKINVSVSGDRDLIISVSDDGPGVPKNEQEAVFARFGGMKIGPKEGVRPSGLGFGLSCVKTLVDVMGGEIALQTEEGVGTTFTVRVPPFKSIGEKEAAK